MDHAEERSADGTVFWHPDRPESCYRPLKAFGHFRQLLKNKEDTAEVFKIFESLPHLEFVARIRELVLSEQGEHLRKTEPHLPEILDDHETLRKLPRRSVAHAYCDFMEREGLTAAGLVAEQESLGRKKYDDLVQWFAERSRDTHDLFHVLTGYGRDALGEQCVLLFTHGQSPSHGHLLIGYAGGVHMKRVMKGSKAPIFKALRQAQRTGREAETLISRSIRDLLAMDLFEARRALNIPAPTAYQECHRVWREEEGVDPYDLLGAEAELAAAV
ncbi:MAG: Coq4 family protein [Pacificimonas sp.]|jgi:ubiquinone biosynthesis protein COQ4|nr:Coq4 family protein [Pacificimonas sp.]